MICNRAEDFVRYFVESRIRRLVEAQRSPNEDGRACRPQALDIAVGQMVEDGCEKLVGKAEEHFEWVK